MSFGHYTRLVREELFLNLVPITFTCGIILVETQNNKTIKTGYTETHKGNKKRHGSFSSI